MDLDDISTLIWVLKEYIMAPFKNLRRMVRAGGLKHPFLYHKRMRDLKEFIEYIDETYYILRKMTHGPGLKIYIAQLLLFKFLSDMWDEEYKIGMEESGNDTIFAKSSEFHRFQIPENCHFEDMRKKTVNIGEALQNALDGIDKANLGLLKHILEFHSWTSECFMNDAKMTELIEHISKINLSEANLPQDVMDMGFEYLLTAFSHSYYCYMPFINR